MFHLPKCIPKLKIKLSQSHIEYPLTCRVERNKNKISQNPNFVPEFRWQEFKPPPVFQDRIFLFRSSTCKNCSVRELFCYDNHTHLAFVKIMLAYKPYLVKVKVKFTLEHATKA